MPAPAGGLERRVLDTSEFRIGATIDVDAPQRTSAWLLTRGQSQQAPSRTLAQAPSRPGQVPRRKRAPPTPGDAGQGASAPRPLLRAAGAHARAEAGRRSGRGLRHPGARRASAGAVASAAAVGLLILVGAVGSVIGLRRGLRRWPAADRASGRGRPISTVEVTLREHLSGYRSHTLLLAVFRRHVPLGGRARRLGVHAPAAGGERRALAARRPAGHDPVQTAARALLDARRERPSPEAIGQTSPRLGSGPGGDASSEGSGRSPGAPSPRVSPVSPRLSRRAISRSPSTRAGCPSASPAISRAMRLRSCRAKWGVEAPINSRTSSTLTSPVRSLQHGGWGLGLAHGPVVVCVGSGSLEGAVGEATAGSVACREDISSSESSCAWVVAGDGAFVADQPAVIVNPVHGARRRRPGLQIAQVAA